MKQKKHSPSQRKSKRSFNANQRKDKTGDNDVLFLYGLHTVRSAMDNPERKKLTLFASENGLARLDHAVVAQSQIQVEVVHGSELTKFVGPEAVHQGVVLKCAPLEALDASELFHLADKSLVLALDQITDPHNVGAIMRSAVAMGVDAILMTSRNSATETAVLAKSASGALDLVKTVHLRNFTKGLDELNDMGFVTIGLDSEGPLVLEETIHQTNAQRVCLVLGAEGKGLRMQTRETCSALARLDMPGPIKSLNVSNAAALSLYIVSQSLIGKQ